MIQLWYNNCKMVGSFCWQYWTTQQNIATDERRCYQQTCPVISLKPSTIISTHLALGYQAFLPHGRLGLIEFDEFELLGFPRSESGKKGLKNQCKLNMSCGSVNAVVSPILMSMSQEFPSFNPFTNLPSLYTARSSPQMSSWWWSSQTKLGRRMPGITLVRHGKTVESQPKESDSWWCMIMLNIVEYSSQYAFFHFFSSPLKRKTNRVHHRLVC